MHYTPKHAKTRPAIALKTRILGVAAASGATVAASVAVSTPANAAGSVWDRVARCESGGNWSINTGNGYYGGLQFSRSSWRAAGGTRYASLPHKASRVEQIMAAQQLLRMQGPGAWPVCSRKAGLTRANGLIPVSGSSAKPGKKVTVKRVFKVGGANVTSYNVRVLQDWLGRSKTGVWTTGDTRAFQRKVGARADGTIDRDTVRRTERLVGATLSGRSTFSSTSMRWITRYAARH